MPQFDKITFFNQVFWLFAFFSSSYLIFLKLFLPKLSRLMKARTKKLYKGSSGIDDFLLEQHNTSSFFNSSVEKLMTFVKDDLFSYKIRSSSWLDLTKNQLEKKDLFNSNMLLEKTVYKRILLDYLLSNLKNRKKLNSLKTKKKANLKKKKK